MQTYLDLDRFALDQPQSGEYAALVTRCRAELAAGGMCNLDGFLRPAHAIAQVDDLTPAMDSDSFLHARDHNIYFQDTVPGLPDDHPALERFQTSNNTLCRDQLRGSIVDQIYDWPPMRAFLADVMQKPMLHPMADPLAGVNVMRYGEGQALNWHFDRAEFTVTLLLQAPEAGGVFKYRTNLRDAQNPNYDGVGKLLRGQDPQMQQMDVVPGTLNIFRGVNTPHRVTPIQGARARVIAVLTYFEKPDVMFSDAEQRGFYGRTATT